MLTARGPETRWAPIVESIRPSWKFTKWNRNVVLEDALDGVTYQRPLGGVFGRSPLPLPFDHS